MSKRICEDGGRRVRRDMFPNRPGVFGKIMGVEKVRADFSRREWTGETRYPWMSPSATGLGDLGAARKSPRLAVVGDIQISVTQVGRLVVFPNGFDSKYAHATTDYSSFINLTSSSTC